MININTNLKEGRGNGALCRGVSVCLEYNYVSLCKNLDKRKIHCASVDNIERVTCEY